MGRAGVSEQSTLTCDRLCTKRSSSAPWLVITKHYPVDRNANIRQGYFFPFDFEGTRAVLSCVEEPLPAWLSALVARRTLSAESTNSRTEGSPGSSRSGGFGEPEQSTEVEQVAVRVVTEWYSNRGWEVVSVENQRCGFDLLCRRNGTEAHVEVKPCRPTR